MLANTRKKLVVTDKRAGDVESCSRRDELPMKVLSGRSWRLLHVNLRVNFRGSHFVSLSDNRG
jgi:hypothetical protein